ncbi:PREDICTED: pre-mRNA 3' end processing protein WDR33-like [Priapulus caudatus]|uniref:Pre-mRNA 3' end processing protein WDR33-like n=1 Tax=Priapulus caudatus TaxID=37621 RepID=A0ABM1ENH8_PRICU|nr:PREDICTED: pre-mRNA 3' end processing protein WDR33-like [Priapulus caudatus]XP_014673750.1 PREDICTED: pre-mRNA 3' end processing protein WDR33-like [Priapulus caudatus]
MDANRPTFSMPSRFNYNPRFNPNYPRGRGRGHNYGFQFRPSLSQSLDPSGNLMNPNYDGKRMRKTIHRRTIDYNSHGVTYLENRVWQRDCRDQRAIQPDALYTSSIMPAAAYVKNPVVSVATKCIRTSMNKLPCPIFCVCWTPEGRRLITGASSGEFTLWNGLTFNFETILQAHDAACRTMVWSHNDQWMITGDHSGFVKYWQTNMNNVKMFQAHKESVRSLSFCPTDNKFASSSDDGTVRVWDFLRCHEEKILRGHGADVKFVDWHPQKALLASGSKDTQQPVKLWDPKTGQSLATLHIHKGTVMSVRWNQNGNWLLSASRDHLVKVFDIRAMKELQTFRGHKKEACSLAWHPVHESLFASGGSVGDIVYWQVGQEKEVASVELAHENMVWTMAWHPLGHILATGSNDHTTKFWARPRPGEKLKDKASNDVSVGDVSLDDSITIADGEEVAPVIPGMGLEHGIPEHLRPKEKSAESLIPGLEWADFPRPVHIKKTPYAKPIPKQFEEAWQSATTSLPVPDDSGKSKPKQNSHGAQNNVENNTSTEKPTSDKPNLDNSTSNRNNSFSGDLANAGDREPAVQQGGPIGDAPWRGQRPLGAGGTPAVRPSLLGPAPQMPQPNNFQDGPPAGRGMTGPRMRGRGQFGGGDFGRGRGLLPAGRASILGRPPSGNYHPQENYEMDSQQQNQGPDHGQEYCGPGQFPGEHDGAFGSQPARGRGGMEMHKRPWDDGPGAPSPVTRMPSRGGMRGGMAPPGGRGMMPMHNAQGVHGMMGMRPHGMRGPPPMRMQMMRGSRGRSMR